MTTEGIPIKKFLFFTLSLFYRKLLGFRFPSILLFMETHGLMESEMSFSLSAIALLFAQLSFGNANIKGEWLTAAQLIPSLLKQVLLEIKCDSSHLQGNRKGESCFLKRP